MQLTFKVQVPPSFRWQVHCASFHALVHSGELNRLNLFYLEGVSLRFRPEHIVACVQANDE